MRIPAMLGHWFLTSMCWAATLHFFKSTTRITPQPI